jgi:hypothetical protein
MTPIPYPTDTQEALKQIMCSMIPFVVVVLIGAVYVYISHLWQELCELDKTNDFKDNNGF